MPRAKHLLAAGALIALAGCVTDDPYYSYSDSGYGSSYGSGYSYPSNRSYSYDRGTQYSYDRGNRVECSLPGEDQVMSRRDCRRMQRQYGRTEREAELRGSR